MDMDESRKSLLGQEPKAIRPLDILRRISGNNSVDTKMTLGKLFLGHPFRRIEAVAILEHNTGVQLWSGEDREEFFSRTVGDLLTQIRNEFDDSVFQGELVME